MTYEESLNRIKKNTVPIDWTEADKEHYNNIVTAIEKRIPKKPLVACGHTTDRTMTFCPKCGQALDWSDEA